MTCLTIGPGEYATPHRKPTGGRISDAHPMTSDDYKLRDAAVRPGPLEYSRIDAVLPKGGRFYARAQDSSFGIPKGPGPGEYEVKSGIGTRPTTRMSTAAKTTIIQEEAKRRSFTPGPGHYRTVRDESVDMIAAKQRLAKLKLIANHNRHRAATGPHPQPSASTLNLQIDNSDDFGEWHASCAMRMACMIRDDFGMHHVR
jgi:hypothetical protein